MPAPRQMFDNTLDVLKGWLPSNMGSVDKAAKISSNVQFTLKAGRVVHLNNSGEFEPGCRGTEMAIFLFQNADDYDVQNFGGTGTDTLWVPVHPTGTITGLVAIGGYELATTEFDKARTYNYNDLLRAPGGNAPANEATSGVLTNQGVVLYNTTNATAVCGVVSKPPETNAHGKMVLSFWPIYLPGVGGN